MGKSKSKGQSALESTSQSLELSAKAIDPALASLFASSAGPVKSPKRATVSSKDPEEVIRSGATASQSDDPEQDLVLRTGTPSDAGLVALPTDLPNSSDTSRPRKRRKLDSAEDIEASYFNRLAREEEREQQQREDINSNDGGQTNGISESLDHDDGAVKISPPPSSIPRHEALDKSDTANDLARSKKTVFLSNVSTEAIKSKVAKKSLIKHLESVLDSESGAKVESLRFRSTAFASGVGPKRAAFAKKELMEQTMRSTNAYAVFTTEKAAKRVARKLNGSMVLDRHLRADYLAKPAEIDHRRCVFVGNLSFVDEETVEEPEDGESKQRRAKARDPADAEEGLWRTFGKVGEVESVRVVRDSETRVSKGFAYVQFTDENGVEAALLLNEKKFPPMLPRKLRVMRARRMKPTSSSAPRRSVSTSAVPRRGRNRPERGKAQSGPKQRRQGPGVVFEGHRASKASGGNPLKHKKRRTAKPKGRSSKRGAAFKAAGGKRKRDE